MTKAQKDLIAKFQNVPAEFEKIRRDYNVFGGACNFDSAAVKLPRVKSETLQAITDATGITFFKFTVWGGSWYWVNYPNVGYHQGSGQTMFAEDVTRALQTAGIEARTYYALD